MPNFKTSEKELERKIEHRYVVSDPQFRHEMSVAPKIHRKDSATNQIAALIKEILSGVRKAGDRISPAGQYRRELRWQENSGHFSKTGLVPELGGVA